MQDFNELIGLTQDHGELFRKLIALDTIIIGLACLNTMALIGYSVQGYAVWATFTSAGLVVLSAIAGLIAASLDAGGSSPALRDIPTTPLNQLADQWRAINARLLASLRWKYRLAVLAALCTAGIAIAGVLAR
ncbi:MAG: hypothetical protein AAGF24_12185 [Cyanobacteria bacterium P01_H01_bin.121]